MEGLSLPNHVGRKVVAKSPQVATGVEDAVIEPNWGGMASKMDDRRRDGVEMRAGRRDFVGMERTVSKVALYW
ncbi:hypothetical protein LWI28_013334 [Acer negundo]|uniref:Uncharacterized protein n=1 Tax=Acer negundo TaxID=4023 RepID=A0AAD5JJ11_ACENE|nr:hypothetical protein LWI28_013334 [Acer negundo]